MDKNVLIEELTNQTMTLMVLENHIQTMEKMEENTKRKIEMEIGTLHTPIGDLDVYVLANHPKRFALKENNIFLEYATLETFFEEKEAEFSPLQG